MKIKETVETKKSVRIELTDEDIIRFLIRDGTLEGSDVQDIVVEHDNAGVSFNYPVIVSYSNKTVIEDGEI